MNKARIELIYPFCADLSHFVLVRCVRLRLEEFIFQSCGVNQFLQSMNPRDLNKL